MFKWLATISGEMVFDHLVLPKQVVKLSSCSIKCEEPWIAAKCATMNYGNYGLRLLLTSVGEVWVSSSS